MAYLMQDDRLDARQRDCVEHIQRSGRTLLGLLNDVLDFSKIEADRLELEQVEFRLDDLLEDQLRLIARPAADKGLFVSCHLPVEVPERVLGDPTRLGQVLANLLSNAVKFTDSGHLRLSVYRHDEATLRFEVEDTGTGIPTEQQAGLFEAFTQADRSITRRYGGSGLGLAISRRLVERMGGTIGVSSQAGEGTCFTFTARLPQVAPFTPPSELRGRTLTLVLKGGGCLPSACQLFASLGLQVTCASLEMALEEPADLLVVDAGLAGANELATRHPRALLLCWPGDQPAERDQPVMYLPCVRARAASTLSALLRGQPQGDLRVMSRQRVQGARVLIVEDNATNQRILRELLEQAGIRVDSADHGLEALSKVLANEYDLVLMDLQMPVMDGYTAVTQIRAHPALRSLPIVAVTANVLAEERERCRAAGLDDYLAKPIDPDHLFATIRRWLPAVAAPSRCQEFPSIPGIDTAAGLARTAGNASLYARLLRDFAAENARQVSELEGALAAGDLALAIRLAHTLKGAAGNLGLDSVQQLARRLEGDLRQGDREGAAPQLRDLDRALSAARQAIQTALGEATEPAPGPGSNQDEDALRVLAQQLSTNDAGALENLEAGLAAAPSAWSRERLERIRRAVQDFDFEAALRELA